MPGARPKLLTGTVDAKHISVMHCGCANSNVVCLQLGKKKHVHDEAVVILSVTGLKLPAARTIMTMKIHRPIGM